MKKHNNPNLIQSIFTVTFMIVFLTSCYGPRLNKKHEESNIDNQSLAANFDSNISITLQKLIVRNSKDSWAKDANWDEYIFSIDNLNSQEITIHKISITDGLNIEVLPEVTRRSLNKKTRKTKNRFNKQGIKIVLGKGSTGIATASVTSVALGTGLAAGAASSGSIAVSAGTLTTAGGAVVVAVPAIAIGGIIKVVNNSKINNKIQERQTILPFKLSDGINSLDIFYPAIPSPKIVTITYLINDQEHRLNLTLPESFKGLHYK